MASQQVIALTVVGYLVTLIGLVQIPLAKGCGGVITANSGSITSPGYPGNYGGSLSCTYTIVPAPGVSLQLVFGDFETESGYDFVRVYNSSDFQLTALTGSRSGTVVQTSTSYKVVLSTDPWTHRRGFKATWSASPSSSVDPEFGLYTLCPLHTGFTLVSSTSTKVKVLELLPETRCRTLCTLLAACTHYKLTDTGMCKLYKYDAAASVDFVDVWAKN
ncbi:embryonic protein UVS.2-like [Haliotis asinina]|uniref:embryonic protein UVS.2-like n=1 Tax=Haliotis asinina TaxID=109174 RepID=UPI0035322110